MREIFDARSAGTFRFRRSRERIVSPITSLYFVYVLCNAAGTLYTGIAKDTEARLGQHNAGAGARFTRGRGPWRMVHWEGPFAHGQALRREAALKADRRFKAALKAGLAGSKRK